jgi:5-methylcytosine-specific restriction endonuclease McrA
VDSVSPFVIFARELFIVDQEKLSQYNEGRLQAHIDNKCAFCAKELHDLRKIYCNAKCRRKFSAKYRYITHSWASTRWRALRRDHFLCVPCAREGRRTYSREVDHIIEIADGGNEFDLANTQTICKRHHRIKTAENNRLRAQKRRSAKQPSNPATTAIPEIIRSSREPSSLIFPPEPIPRVFSVPAELCR